MRRIWSEHENEALVADYISMLKAEQLGMPFNKAAHVRELIPLLDSRSKGAIEDKHENVSAIANQLGFPSIDGYKPQGNYQRLLFRVAAQRLLADEELAAILSERLTARATVPAVVDSDTNRVSPPRPLKGKLESESSLPELRRPRPNWLEIEAANRSLGRAGEEWVLANERNRLALAGRSDLAERVDHVAVSIGDGLGFDIHSFETRGSDRLIEVKTTSNPKETPFFVTRNELRVSRVKEGTYHLYRVFRFRTKPQFFVLSGSLDSRCVLDPIVYLARAK